MGGILTKMSRVATRFHNTLVPALLNSNFRYQALNINKENLVKDLANLLSLLPHEVECTTGQGSSGL
jgi:hypothetical protein